MMEVKRESLKGHLSVITVVLREVCEVSNRGPLAVLNDNLTISAFGPLPLARDLTTDFGLTERALPLPIPDASRPKYWISLHENLQSTTGHRVRFVDCGLRLYVGARDEDAAQIVRLEWVAPDIDRYGQPVYAGKHAAHPHWHIDRSALIGAEEYWQAIDILTAPEPKNDALEDFGQTTTSPSRSNERTLYDLSWLNKVHFPALARWTECEWDGHTIPGPHQCEPESLKALESWWLGALRYIASELPR